MKKLIFLFLAGCSGELPIDESQEALLAGGFVKPAPPQLILLTVDPVEPAKPVESRPVFLHFTLDNSTKVARSGFVQADVTRQDGTILKSNAWNLSVGAYASASGVLAFDSPYAGPNVQYAVHYYNSSAPTVPAESNATQASFTSAIRTKLVMESVTVARPADPVLGDRDVARLLTFFNGAAVDYRDRGLGYLREYDFKIGLASPTLDLVPGTADVASFWATIERSPNWGGAPQNVVNFPLTVNGDQVRAFVADGRYAQITSRNQAYFYPEYCNGLEVAPCATGPYYWFQAYLERTRPDTDTVPVYHSVIQMGVNQLLWLTPSQASARIISGEGTILNQGQVTYLAPMTVSGPMLVTISLTDGVRNSMVYVEVHQ